MRVARSVAGLAAAITAVLGTGVATAGSAVATESGVWRAYGNVNPITDSTSTWRCTSTKAIATNVGAQVCAIRSASGSSVQAAVIVRNNGSGLYAATARMDLVNSYSVYRGDWECPSSGVAANSWSVCFGRTLTEINGVNSAGSASGTALGVSPYV